MSDDNNDNDDGDMSGEYVCQITSEEGEVLEQTHRLQVITCHLISPMCNVLVTRLLSRPPLPRTRAGSLGDWGRAWCSDATPTAAPPPPSTGTRVSGALSGR